MPNLDEIILALREKADYCHNNISSKTWEDWEKMDKFLCDCADSLIHISNNVHNGVNYRATEDDICLLRKQLGGFSAHGFANNDCNRKTYCCK